MTQCLIHGHINAATVLPYSVFDVSVIGVNLSAFFWSHPERVGWPNLDMPRTLWMLAYPILSSDGDIEAGYPTYW